MGKHKKRKNKSAKFMRNKVGNKNNRYTNNWVSSASPEHLAELKQRRRDRLLVATPKWANQDHIKDYYKLARNQNLTVDHIIPLLGDWNGVCGLHTLDNFQMLSNGKNVSKGARFNHNEHTWFSDDTRKKKYFELLRNRKKLEKQSHDQWLKEKIDKDLDIKLLFEFDSAGFLI